MSDHSIIAYIPQFLLNFFLNVGRSKKHAPGSLEETVSDIIKTFEMEGVHKERLEVDIIYFTPY